MLFYPLYRECCRDNAKPLDSATGRRKSRDESEYTLHIVEIRLYAIVSPNRPTMLHFWGKTSEDACITDSELSFCDCRVVAWSRSSPYEGDQIVGNFSC